MMRLHWESIVTRQPTENQYNEALRQLSDTPPHLRIPICRLIRKIITDPQLLVDLATLESASGLNWRMVLLDRHGHLVGGSPKK